MKITNPVLRGFNPDPSIIRVGDDYYIATSTFEWFPGVQIHHSKDLVNWKLIARPLSRTSQLDMLGTPDSCGIWAPCLSYDNGTFYLIYTNVRKAQKFNDGYNYLVTTNDISGEWSEPISMGKTGFDSSLFHDDDGKKWYLVVDWEHRKGRNPFGGIQLQEYSTTEKKLIGQKTNIFKGTDIGLVEAPHLYKRNGYYYLVTAEGGTVYKHAVTIARSKSITGPYEVDPQNPVLTSYNNPTLPIQRAGHGSLVETQDGEWYLAHLCGRYLPTRGTCPMGRETALQKMKWTPDNWIRLETGGNEPLLEVTAPNLPEHTWEAEPARDNFDSTELNINFQFLRVVPDKGTFSLTERPGYLRIRGKESLHSQHKQALVARRQQSFTYIAETCVEFEPDSFKQMAGLVAYYDTQNFYYLHISHDEELGKCLDIYSCVKGVSDYPCDKPTSIEGVERCYLRTKVIYDKLYFYYSIDGVNWNSIGTELDASKLSDFFEEGRDKGTFTGAFIGLCCQDLTGDDLYADFDYFEYREVE